MPFSNAFPMVYFFLLRRVHPIKHLSGRAVSLLHLNGAFFRRTANSKIMPRKPYIIFIEGLFSGSNDNYKRFSKYGDRSQAPFSSLFLLSTSCNILNDSPPPISCAENKICRVDCTCACGKCVPFQLHYVMVGFVPQPNQHFILPTLQAYTSAPHGFGKYSFPFRKLHSFRFPQALFNANPMVYFISAACLPR